ncbi:MAG: 3-dehydroquinate synthase [Bacteroidota bacterium]
MSTTLSLPNYSIFLDADWSALVQLLEGHSKVAVLVDNHTYTHCWPLLEEHLSPHTPVLIKIEAGEIHKNIETCQVIWQKMLEAQLDRKSILINLGGGVIGDMGGFCASTFKRGMDFIQVPTTLLSQVDASIGGKLGIDFQGVKNGIGVFRDPKAVFIQPDFLQTLSDRELRSGFAEVLKHALIDDADHWRQLKGVKDLRSLDWNQEIARSLEVKRHIVEEDPFELGARKALNFGHTLGHAIEGQALETESPLLHGEAIAIGMIAEAHLSMQKADLSEAQLQEVSETILGIYEPPALDFSHWETWMHFMRNDKKNESDQILCSLISPIGDYKVNISVQEAEIRAAFEFYQGLVS